MSSLCLHTSLYALVPLGNTIVDNPLIHGRPRTRLHSSHIMTSEQSRFEFEYKVWSVMQEQVYQTPIRDVNDLKQRLLDV